MAAYLAACGIFAFNAYFNLYMSPYMADLADHLESVSNLVSSMCAALCTLHGVFVVYVAEGMSNLIGLVSERGEQR